MMPEDPTSLRERRAQLTRDAILRAARRLFAERGYARTTVRDIAQEAGVSAQTVYDSVGSKQALVSRLNDLIDSEAGVADIVRAAAESGDPWEVAATPARVTRSILEHCGDIVHALVTGAAAEPELAAALAEGHRRHLEGAGGVVGLLRRLDALGPAVDPDDAVETLAAVSDFRFGLVLLGSYGWSLDQLESWIAATSRALVLRDRGPRAQRQTSRSSKSKASS
jgi:AcrR family transcriptional regulator